MNLNYKMIFFYTIGIILLVTGISQTFNQNLLAIVPLACSIVFFVRAWKS